MFLHKAVGAMASFCVAAIAAPALAVTLHPGDRIQVNVYNHPELQLASATIDSTGHVTVPLAGLVDADGETPNQLGSEIRSRLLTYVRRPAVDVQLLSQGQNIFVAGGPGGVLTYSPGEHLAGALAQLQQISDPNQVLQPSDTPARQAIYAGIDLRHVVLARDGHDLPPIDAVELIASGNPGPALQPDDTIELSVKPIAVTVSGDVRQPGIAHLDPAEPLSYSLLQLGGTDELQAARQLVLTRDGREIAMSTSSIEYRSPAQTGDAIFVPHGEHIGVVGQVSKPGDVYLQGDHSVLSAIYYAGGPTKWGDIRNVSVIHNGQTVKYDISNVNNGATGENPQLADGDTVLVPEGHRLDFGLLFQAIIAGSALRFL